MPPELSDIFAAAPARDACQASPFDGILQKSRDLICERLQEAIAVMLDSAHDVLTELIKSTQVREEWRLYEEAREVATAQRDTIEEHFRKAYRADFQRRSDQARKIGKPFDKLEYSFDELELVGEEDYDETLKFDDMAKRVRDYCEEELSALDQRVGVLLGNAALETKDNPFSPQAICDAFKHACRQLETTPPVRRVLLKLFDDEVLDEIRSVYKAVNALLVRNSILPQIRYGVARKSDASAGAARGGETPEAANAAAASGAGKDLFSVLQSLVAANVAAYGGMPGAAAMPVAAAQPAIPCVPAAGLPGAMPNAAMPGQSATMAAGLSGGAAAPGGLPALNTDALPALSGGGVVVLQGAELLGALTRIQRGDAPLVEGEPAGAGSESPAGAVVAGVSNVLHQLKTSQVGSGMNPLDRMTLDIIAMLFDELFDDPKVPNAIKALIGRLQIPMLKVAISDKSFFSTKAHPARKLLDAVGDVALRLPAEFNESNPLFARIETIVQQLVEGYNDSLDVFDSTREELLGLMAEEDRRIEEATREQAKQVEEAEQLSLARAAAQKEVLARIRVRDVPAPVLKFIAQEWVKLLLLVHAKEGVDSDAWTDALAAMDELIWSVEPKSSNEERRKLARMIPSLVKRLKAGLEAAAIDEAVRAKFFAELMGFHMQAISAVARVASETSFDATIQMQAPLAAAEAGRREASGQTAAQAAQPEKSAASSLDFTAPITVQNPFGAGEVAVDNLDLDFTAEAVETAKAKREASIRRALDNLRMGHWVEFCDPANEAKPKAGRLIFISPQRTRYLFATDRAGKEIIQCSRAEIGRRFLTGQAVRLDEPPEESLFDRIMGGLLSKLRLSGRPALFAQ